MIDLFKQSMQWQAHTHFFFLKLKSSLCIISHLTLILCCLVSGLGDPDSAAGRPVPTDPDGPQQVGVPGGLHRVPDLPGHRVIQSGMGYGQPRKPGIICYPEQG